MKYLGYLIKDYLNRNGLSLIIPCVLISAWIFFDLVGFLNPLFLPSPWSVISETYLLFRNGEILPHVAATVSRMFFGLFVSIFLGLPIGLLMGYYPKVYRSLEFLVDFFRSIPATALFPLFLLFFGVGDEAKIAVVVYACSLIIIVYTMDGVRHVKELRIIAAKTMKISGTTLIRKVILPDALPEIFTGLKISISLALVLVVVAEMFIGTNYGLGHLIIDAQLVYKIPQMYVAIMIVGILGYLLNKVFGAMERYFVHWAGK